MDDNLRNMLIAMDRGRQADIRSEMTQMRMLIRSLWAKSNGDAIEPGVDDYGVSRTQSSGLNLEQDINAADAQWINWWGALGLADDDITSINVIKFWTDGTSKILIVGGTFNRIGGVDASNIAVYDFATRSWSELGGGLNGSVSAIAVDNNNDIICGGGFTDAGGVANADHIARWDGASWNAYGSGLNANVAALVVDASNNVYAGGSFLNAGGVAAADYMAMWNGAAWVALGSALNAFVAALVIDNDGNVIVGGEFTSAGGIADANGVAKWTGAAWEKMGTVDHYVIGTVYALAIDPNGHVVTGGAFDITDLTNSSNIARWDGSDWYSYGDGLSGAVNELAIYSNGDVVAVGTFTDAGGNAAADKIAIYKGTNWEPVTNGGGLAGPSANVSTVALDTITGSIYVGGVFETAGAIKVNSIAFYARPLSDMLDTLSSLFEIYQERGDAKYMYAALFGAVSGVATLDANSRVNESINRLISGTAALATTEGYLGWQSTTKRLLLYDAQRERALSPVGWTPAALPLIYDPSAALTTAYTIAANGGTLAIPILVTGHMLLQGVTVRNTDTATARSWRWHLYEQYLNNGNAGENTLTRIESGNGNDTFTPGAASNRTLNGTGAPTYLAPGVYWLAIQNVHATSTFGLGSTAAGSAFAPNSAQSKTLAVPLGATLDFVAATWTKLADIYGVRLNGRVFGQTTAF